jgi:glycine betaine/proline transport system permease protein
MLEFPTALKIPLGDAIDSIMDWVLHNMGGFFDAIGNAILQLLVFIERVLQGTPWFVILLIIFLVGWWSTRRWWKGLGLALLFGLIGTFGRGSATPYWELAMSTLAVVITSVFISLALGIPTGILMARSNKAQTILKPILDGMQTMPSFVYSGAGGHAAGAGPGFGGICHHYLRRAAGHPPDQCGHPPGVAQRGRGSQGLRR